MEKRVILGIILFMLLEIVSAIRINEVEINPKEGKQGKEWIEIYNDKDENIEISLWEIYDGLTSEKKRYTFPKGSILEKGDYIIVEFSSALFNNDGDYVILYDENKKEIDRTPELKEEEASDKTWQYCKEWIFIEKTKNRKNSCEEENLETQGQSANINKDINKNISGYETKEEKTKEPITFQTISLTQNIKSTPDNKELSKNYALYSLMGFGVLIGLLFVIRKIKSRKNEFD